MKNQISVTFMCGPRSDIYLICDWKRMDHNEFFFNAVFFQSRFNLHVQVTVIQGNIDYAYINIQFESVPMQVILGQKV